jgi:hypothetical protein
MRISEFNRVRLKIVNLHQGGLTAAELRLAAKTSAVIDEHEASASLARAAAGAPDFAGSWIAALIRTRVGQLAP